MKGCGWDFVLFMFLFETVISKHLSLRFIIQGTFLTLSNIDDG
jgi:hypothetical protein